MAARRLFLVDGTALAYRSFFAFIRNPLTTSKGLNTSAVFGFTQALSRLMDAEPDATIVVAWDAAAPTFRHKQFAQYKATREKMPDEMRGQLPYVEQVVHAYGLPFLALPGWEADDIIGTLAKEGAEAGWRVVIVAGDKDFMQLVDDRIALWIPRPAGDFEKLTPEGVKQRMGVPPERIVDLLGLMGDSSDNVPGVKGVGEKTAKDLLAQFGTLEGALHAATKLKGKKLYENLVACHDLALLSKQLVTIDTAAPVSLQDVEKGRGEPDPERLAALFAQLEFKGLMKTVVRAEKKVESAYRVVEPQGIAGLCDELRRAEAVAVHAVRGPSTKELLGIAFAAKEGQAAFVATPNGAVPPAIAALVGDPRVLKGAHDVKEGMRLLHRRGVKLQGLAFDTMLAAYLIDPAQRQQSLDDLCARHLGLKRRAGDDGAKQPSLPLGDTPPPPRREVHESACQDADLTLRLHRHFAPQLAAIGVDELYRRLELPLVPVLLSMELAGVKVDAAILKRMSEQYEQRLRELERTLHEMAGVEFNVNSPKQLGTILFEKLQIQKTCGPSRVRRTKTGYSTDAEVLEQYAEHPIVAKILESRNLSKLKGTYLDALPLLIDPDDGRIHTSYNQAVAATGRLSSSDPNLQNIPIRTEDGRAIRSAFVAEEGQVLLSADYSQIELRILAHLTDDPGLLEVFRADRDVHRETAARVFGVAPENVTTELRSRSKAINFGIAYGMGPQRLARETGLPLKEAQSFIANYFATFPGVRRYIDKTKEQAHATGAVQTLLGRRRELPEIHSGNDMLRVGAENAAINTPIQGTAADLIKLAMIKLHARLARERLQATMILQVHDELVLEVPESELGSAKQAVREEMEGAIALAVPLKVDMGSGRSWLQAHA